MIRFFFSFALFALPFLLGLGWVNVALNPSGLFSVPSDLRAQAKVLLRGKSLINPGESDERLFQQIWIAQRPLPPGFVILGSSRTLQLSPAALGETAGANHSISGATLEDVFAVLEAFARRGQIPRKIFWDVDPWMLNSRNGNHGYSAIAENYFDFCDTLGLSMRRISLPALLEKKAYPRLRLIFSPTLFQTALKGAIRAWWRKEPRVGAWFPADAPDPRFDSRNPDGTVIFPEQPIQNDTLAVRNGAEQWASATHVYPLDGFSALEPDYLRQFTRALEWMRSHHMQVTLYLPPFHPAAWGILVRRPQGRLMPEAEDWVRAQAATFGLSVLGSWNPNHVPIGGSAFLDALHLRREAFPLALKPAEKP